MEKKRNWLWKAATIIVLIMLVFIAWFQYQKSRTMRFEASYFELFDTVIQISGYAESQAEFDRQAEEIRARLSYYSLRFDIYQEYPNLANLKTVNDNAGKKPVQVDEEVLDLVELGLEMYERSEGKLNIALGSVLKIWHDHRQEANAHPETAKIPTREKLEEAARHTSIKDIVLDREKRTIYLRDEKMSLDVGAIAKGYAVERVAREMEQAGLTGYLLNAGGNVRAIGEKPDGKAWKVGVQNPNLQEKKPYVEIVRLREETFVTSGDYQRYYEVKGKTYHHIIDPQTLMPAEYVRSVSIIGKDGGREDAHSTIAFCLPVEQGLKYIEAIKGVEAMWILSNGEIVYTSGFGRYINEEIR